MANYANLKSDIAGVIRTNNNEEITGDILQEQLLGMVDSLGAGFQYKGVATPATAPGTPDENVFYIASTAGTYTNFGGLVVAEGEVAILKYNGSWAKEVTGAATAAQVTQLGQEVGTNKDNITNLQQEIDSIQPIIIEGNVTNAPDEEDITTDSNDLLKFADRPTAVNQMGYVILRKNKTFAEQVTQENTIYEIRYYFDLNNRIVTIPSGCALHFVGGSLYNGAISAQNTLLTGEPIFDNSRFIGTIKNRVIYSSWFKNIDDLAKAASLSTGYEKIDVAKGEYTITYPFRLSGNVDVDFHGSKFDIKHTNGFLELNLSEEQTFLTNLSTEASVGDKSISVSDATGIKRGDVLLLLDETANSYNSYNVVNSARNYKQGEFIFVYSVDGTTIKLVKPLYGFYVSANLSNCKLYKINLYHSIIENVELTYAREEGESSRFGIRISNCIDSIIRNIKCTGIDVNIGVSYCYNAKVTGCEIFTPLDAIGPGDRLNDQYGVIVSNSQEVLLSNIIGSCGNHLCATAGGIFPTRRIRFEHIISNSIYPGYCGINMHGATEYTTIDDCVVSGIEFGGDYITVRNSQVYERVSSDTNLQYAIATGEVTGYNITIDNCEISGRWYDRHTHFGGINNKTSLFVVKNSKWTDYHSSFPLRRQVSVGGVAQDVRFVIDNCEFLTTDSATITWNYLSDLTVKNSKLINSLFHWRSNGSVKFVNNEILTGYMAFYYQPNGVGEVHFIRNTIKTTASNSATALLFIQTATNIINCLEFTNNYIEALSGGGTIQSKTDGAVKNLIFKGNVTNQLGGNAYIQIKANYAWVSPTPELSARNHVIITSSNISEGTNLVPASS